MNPVQKRLLKAAKVGNINLMKEYIKIGADPYMPDEHGHNAVFYLKRTAPEKSGQLHFWILLILMHKFTTKLLNENEYTLCK